MESTHAEKKDKTLTRSNNEKTVEAEVLSVHAAGSLQEPCELMEREAVPSHVQARLHLLPTPLPPSPTAKSSQPLPKLTGW